MIVQVAVNVPGVNGVFDYGLPAALQGQVSPGSLVEAPFGKQAVQGVVLGLADTSEFPNTRPLTALLDRQPVLTSLQLRLAQILADETLSPLSACIDLMLPPGLSRQADTLYSPSGQPGASSYSLPPLEKRLLQLLAHRGPLRGRQINTAIPRMDWRPAARALVKQALISAQPVLPPPAVRPKFVRTAQIACSPAKVQVYIVSQKGSSASQRRARVLRYLLDEAVPVQTQFVYGASGATLQDLKTLAEHDLILLSETEVWRDPLEGITPSPAIPPELTHEQRSAWDALRPALESAAAGSAPVPILIQGVTGSGKTELYLRAVEETLRQGRQALVLVPEIALTPQTVRRFMARFTGQVGLIHSRLSPGERYDTWRRARAGLLPVIIGPRSALFTPLPNPGLIVIDECHEDSYYQDETPPFYNAVEAALEYARLGSAAVIFGSATPDIAMTFRARREGWTELHLPYRMLAHVETIRSQQERLGLQMPELPGEGQSASLPLPEVQVVDMREELKNGNRSLFSTALRNALAETLAAGQQAILYLNRRGDATYVFCRACGYSLRCPRCDTPLTLHSDQQALLCHRCRYTRQVPRVCPQCGSSQFRQYGAGTEKVETEAAALLPNARILRWDADTTRSRDAHEILLAHFAGHRADILIGTRMLAKGLDLPLVTLVGVVLGDVGLNLPDFRAGERTFQLLTQVAGRAGRSPLGGRAILQTFQPQNYVISAAADHDTDGFYKTELGYREKMGYPPYARLLRMEFRHTRAEQAEKEASRVAEVTRAWLDEGGFTATEMIGPAPCFYSRKAGDYRWQIILRGPNPAAVLRDKPLPGWRLQVDPPDLL